jgi:large subunit ribosomal protein L15
MQQHDIRSPKGATHKRKRVGRGNASGHGTYSTRGLKGQKARAGGGVRPSFEGGQLPFVRRMARKRGFRNPFRVDYEEVNIGDLAAFAEGSEVNVEALRQARLVRTGRPVKVLGNGELSAALTVEADAFSKSARSKIEAAGGTVRWIGGEPAPAPEPEPAPAKGKKAAAETVAAPEGAEADAKPKARKAKAKKQEPAEAEDAESDDGAVS